VKIIYVQGVFDAGKTSSIRRFLTNRRVLFEYKDNGTEDVSLMLPMMVSGQQKDVAVCTNGDEASAVQGHLDWALSNSADILVCACRSRGGTLTAILDFAKLHSFPTYPIQCSRTAPPSPCGLCCGRP